MIINSLIANGGTPITIEELNVDTNGTYTAPSGKAYSPVNVNVSGGSDADYAACIGRTTNTPTLPSTLTAIGNYAFYNWQTLALTSLPTGLSTIGNYAFYNCYALAFNALPSTVTSIGNSAFYGCNTLALTSLPSGLTTLGNYAFYNCTHLALTSLPSGLTTLESSVFSGCTNLAVSSVPPQVTAIGSSAFYSCKHITVSSLPSTVTSIGQSAFYGCSGITSITCASTLGTSGMGTQAFFRCSNLKVASFPNMTQTSLGTTFGHSTALNACQSLETIDIGKTKGITINAFANCYKLQTLILRRTDAICTLANVAAFNNTPMNGYNSLTGTVYVPSALISTYQTASNWSTLYNNGTLTFAAIEGSPYEL